jgi:hypothetical protein
MLPPLRIRLDCELNKKKRLARIAKLLVRELASIMRFPSFCKKATPP